MFADGVYEVIPAYQGKPFRLPQHLVRLCDGLAQVGIPSPYTDKQWQHLIDQLIDKNGGGHLSIYIQVTRGCNQQRQHVYDSDVQPTVLLMTLPLTTDQQTITCSKVTLLADSRWQHCDIKSTALLANIMLSNQASALGFDEAILHRDHVVTEGASTNVFMVKDGRIYTPEKSHLILGGITRDLIIELCHRAHLEIHQQRIHIDQLLTADEVWISSSSREISPVIQIDDKIIGHGGVGPMSKYVFTLFQQFKRDLITNS
ncbi:aminotransferase class IV [Thalassotalea ponticola]|uniref:aminotransferase class IV n=1 Tax=Thalassotalea ponticola TaxID=1523392 RepID=UPI0025B34C4B|nr:aminotransferase class IV [Thalassotalea ponticola]MDN3652573.1 aminotransferase class IV [Thalassotalea ponticola]